MDSIKELKANRIKLEDDIKKLIESFMEQNGECGFKIDIEYSGLITPSGYKHHLDRSVSVNLALL
jgi:hypothetical protein